MLEKVYTNENLRLVHHFGDRNRLEVVVARSDIEWSSEEPNTVQVYALEIDPKKDHFPPADEVEPWHGTVHLFGRWFEVGAHTFEGLDAYVERVVTPVKMEDVDPVTLIALGIALERFIV